ncbi:MULTISPECIES: Crp/Fnr family transcriptional regulator [Parvimonas]|uniref:Crp/Fnr family transcriptional regulator n=1 Tax=Parvimonas micra TaxID=33033 RepID=A0A3B7DEW1_9FIRM|nr:MULTISPECIES: Crp/Fnr family transcriptional regulator [Parvimonas]AXU10556.1 Crp/Fnr family transcriptional regulator [Parvimonas micra]MBF1307608.1 Crp/Fnr family transcriptional regulator [Parvimonas micra]MEB3028602.1 Crp/Fnr family transcriptional regulator [Parvimonas micra]MEB3058223.1 Crp/Fnr family transcriptional regulator [Parvimonas sp. D9]WBB32988.1 Crp/Fnr family transcriptional regulator [Parvimonas micra]
MNNFETVKECTIFKNFSIDEIIEIFSVISFYEKDYKKNDIILAENTKVEYFGIITNGKIALSNFDYFGNRNILNVFEKGDSFAEALVSLEIQIPHEVISLTDSSIVWIEYKSLSKSLYYQKILNNLLNIISTKNLILNKKLQILSKRTTREKILEYLSNQKKALSLDSNFEINLNRNEMADYLALDRSNLSRELGKLKKEGIIDFKKNKFKLL